MKKLLVTWLCLNACSLMAWGQTEKEDIAIVQSLFGKTKKAIISDYIQVSQADQTAFWELYDEYEDKANKIGADRLGIISRYASNYSTLDEETAGKLAKDLLDNSARYNKLYKNYLRKFTKQVGGLKAATLIQIELYVQTAIQASLQSQVPVIGEITRIQN